MDLIDRNLKALEGMKTGDLIFFYPRSFNLFAKTILFVTNQHYHHGAIVLDAENVIEADLNLGVHTSKISTYLNDYELDLFRLKDPIGTQLIPEEAKKFLGYGYDLGNVVWAGLEFIWFRITGLAMFRKFKNPYDEKNEVESEEYIDLVYRNCGISLRPDIHPTDVTAQDLADSPLLCKVNS